MAEPWQWIPNDILDIEQRRTEAGAWIQQQRQQLAGLWASEQRRQLSDWRQQLEEHRAQRQQLVAEPGQLATQQQPVDIQQQPVEASYWQQPATQQGPLDILPPQPPPTPTIPIPGVNAGTIPSTLVAGTPQPPTTLAQSLLGGLRQGLELASRPQQALFGAYTTSAQPGATLQQTLEAARQGLTGERTLTGQDLINSVGGIDTGLADRIIGPGASDTINQLAGLATSAVFDPLNAVGLAPKVARGASAIAESPTARRLLTEEAGSLLLPGQTPGSVSKLVDAAGNPLPSALAATERGIRDSVLNLQGTARNLESDLTAISGRSLEEQASSIRTNPDLATSVAEVRKAVEGIVGRGQVATQFTNMVAKNPPVLAAVKSGISDDPAWWINYITNTAKPHANDYLSEIYINALLSSPTTHVRNMLSNTVMGLLSIPEKAVSAGIESVVSKLTGRSPERFFGEAKEAAFGLVQGIPEGGRAFLQTLAHSYTPDEAIKLELVRPQAFTGPVGAAINAPARLLQASDRFFSIPFQRAELNSLAWRQASQEGLTGQQFADRIQQLKDTPSKAMLAASKEDANYRLFRAKLGDVGNWLLSGRNADLAGFTPLRYIMPFLQTPINVTKVGLERSPLGFLNPKLYTGTPEASDRIARAVVGTSISAFIVQQMSAGNIEVTGPAPTNAAARDAFYRQGRQPWSLKIAGRYIPMLAASPVDQVLAQVAAVKDAIDQGGDAVAQALNAVQSITSRLADQSFLSSLSDIMDAALDPRPDKLQRILASMATNAMPMSGTLRSLAQATDTTVRQPTTFPERLEANLPVLSQQVPPRLNAFGQPIQREGPAWSPYRTTTPTTDPTEMELARLKVNPGFVGNSIRNVPLTAAEQHDYLITAGTTTEQLLSKVIQSPIYQNLDDATKAKVLDRAISRAQTAAGLQFLKANIGADEIRRRLAPAQRAVPR